MKWHAPDDGFQRVVTHTFDNIMFVTDVPQVPYAVEGGRSILWWDEQGPGILWLNLSLWSCEITPTEYR